MTDDDPSTSPALFDAHVHILDPRFPLTPNRGYVPEPFGAEDYRQRVSHLDVVGGAVVSGSFQGFDTSYLGPALASLGPSFVGVVNLPASVGDEEILELDRVGVRAVRFNLFRGGSAGIADLDRMAHRVFELCGWHVELYVDGRTLADRLPQLLALPRVVIDHLGLFEAGLPALQTLLGAGHFAKLTGFSRLDFDVGTALRGLLRDHTSQLMFGTDLPGTRAPRPFEDDDVRRVVDALDPKSVSSVLAGAAQQLYRPAVPNAA